MLPHGLYAKYYPWVVLFLFRRFREFKVFRVSHEPYLPKFPKLFNLSIISKKALFNTIRRNLSR